MPIVLYIYEYNNNTTDEMADYRIDGTDNIIYQI